MIDAHHRPTNFATFAKHNTTQSGRSVVLSSSEHVEPSSVWLKLPLGIDVGGVGKTGLMSTGKSSILSDMWLVLFEAGCFF